MCLWFLRLREGTVNVPEYDGQWSLPGKTVGLTLQPGGPRRQGLEESHLASFTPKLYLLLSPGESLGLKSQGRLATFSHLKYRSGGLKSLGDSVIVSGFSRCLPWPLLNLYLKFMKN